MFCGNCGAKIPDGAKFCGSCGNSVSLPEAQDTPAKMMPASDINPVPVFNQGASNNDDGKTMMLDDDIQEMPVPAPSAEPRVELEKEVKTEPETPGPVPVEEPVEEDKAEPEMPGPVPVEVPVEEEKVEPEMPGPVPVEEPVEEDKAEPEMPGPVPEMPRPVPSPMPIDDGKTMMLMDDDADNGMSTRYMSVSNPSSSPAPTPTPIPTPVHKHEQFNHQPVNNRPSQTGGETVLLQPEDNGMNANGAMPQYGGMPPVRGQMPPQGGQMPPQRGPVAPAGNQQGMGRAPYGQQIPGGGYGQKQGNRAGRPQPIVLPAKKQNTGMGLIIAILILLILFILGIGCFIAYKGGLIGPGLVVECEQHVDEDGDDLCDECGADMSEPGEDPEPEVCKHKDADKDEICDKCGADLSEGKSESEFDVRALLEDKLDELQSGPQFDYDDTYYASVDGTDPAEAQADSPEGVQGVVWSDIRDCDGDNQEELAVLILVPTSSNENVIEYKFQIYEVDSDGKVDSDSSKSYNLEKYQLYTLEHVVYQADDAIYLVARQHRYKFKDGGKESFYMRVLKYDGTGGVETTDSDDDGIGPDNFKEIFNDIGMSNTASNISKKYEINYSDDVEEVGCMRARPTDYIYNPDEVSDMQYDFYRTKSDMDKAYEDDKRGNSHIPL